MTPRPRTALDLPGAVVGAVGLGAADLRAHRVAGAGRRGPARAGCLALGVLALAGFVLRERTAREPMLPLGIFRSRLFSATNAVTFAVYAALSGVFLFLVLMLQVVAGFSPSRRGRHCCR